MGYMRHHAIIVSSSGEYRDLLNAARIEAIQLGMQVTEIIHSADHRVSTFLVTPDGAKEEWIESIAGDSHRLLFKLWLDDIRQEGGDSLLKWVEVQYGDYDLETCIVSHSEEEGRRCLGLMQSGSPDVASAWSEEGLIRIGDASPHGERVTDVRIAPDGTLWIKTIQ